MVRAPAARSRELFTGRSNALLGRFRPRSGHPYLGSAYTPDGKIGEHSDQDTCNY
jgi:hypothetical protein